MSNDLLAYHKHLQSIAKNDIAYVERKDAQYKASWKQRGGPGAFFTIVRPMDRLQSMAEGWKRSYDIFDMISYEGLDGPDGSMIACVRDLRRYLLLVEAEMVERLQQKHKGDAVLAEDSNKHALQNFPVEDKKVGPKS